MAYIDTIIEDMALFHDNPCAVLEVLAGWGSGAAPPESAPNPSGWTHHIAWTHIVREARTGFLQAQDTNRPWRLPISGLGNTATNARVQQAYIQMWWLMTDGSWRLTSYNEKPGAIAYPYNWSEYEFIDAFQFWRNETIGTSMADIGATNFDRLWHAFGAALPNPVGAIGCVAVCFLRKILDDAGGTDDRANARILGGLAGDWYRSADTANGSDGVKIQGVNVNYMGFSRLKYVTNNWQLFGWYQTDRLTQSQLRANPPPIIGLDLIGGGTNPGPTDPPPPLVPVFTKPIKVPNGTAPFFARTTSGARTFTTRAGTTVTPGKAGRPRRPRIMFDY